MDDIYPWVLAAVVVALGLTVNITARRRRAARHEDSPDSVEAQAHLRAAARSFIDSVVLATVLVLVLVLPTGWPGWVWAVAYLAGMLTVYWVRAARELRILRG